MFDCGCHDNDTSDALNMAFFVHSPSKPTTTQKNNGAFKNLFPTLLHCLQESLLRRLSRRARFFSRSFYCFTKHSFRQIWPRAVFKDYFRCFRGLEKAGFSEKKGCGSKCLFVDHRASRTNRTHDSSERRQHFISVFLTIDKRQHYTIHLSR